MLGMDRPKLIVSEDDLGIAEESHRSSEKTDQKMTMAMP